MTSTSAAPAFPTFGLQRDAHGRLVLTLADGTVHEAVTPVRAFPIAAPGEGLSLVGQHGHELLWIDRLDRIEPALRALIEDELATREFVPTITRIEAVSSFTTPSTCLLYTSPSPRD